MGILFALLAGFFMPFTNFTVRKGLDFRGNTRGYFVFQMLASFTCAFLFGPLRHGDFSFPLTTAFLGCLAGVLLFFMLFALGKALEEGPPGLTFAILNSATVFPGILMAVFFGASLGYEFKLSHAFGCVLVLLGLFWATQGFSGVKKVQNWVLFSGAMFLLHIALLFLYQYRGFLMSPTRPLELFAIFPKDLIQSECFVPCMFLSSSLLQLTLFFRKEKTPFQKGEIYYGVLGGLCNFLVTFFLLAAVQMASALEHAIIYPIFSVMGIILTNLWGQRFYQEQVNWRACQMCGLGLLVGTLDWQAVAAFIGF